MGPTPSLVYAVSIVDAQRKGGPRGKKVVEGIRARRGGLSFAGSSKVSDAE